METNIHPDGVDRVKLVSLREARSLRAADVARLLGISRQRYYHYERGHRRILPSILQQLAAVYGTTTDDLLTRKNFARRVP